MPESLVWCTVEQPKPWRPHKPTITIQYRNRLGQVEDLLDETGRPVNLVDELPNLLEYRGTADAWNRQAQQLAERVMQCVAKNMLRWRANKKAGENPGPSHSWEFGYQLFT